jgi:hypothetical protein
MNPAPLVIRIDIGQTTPVAASSLISKRLMPSAAVTSEIYLGTTMGIAST